MPGGTSFRQTEEKQSSFVIDLMLWSPKMDLIAVTAVTGEVVLHRLSQWQKAWTLSSPCEGTVVSALAWRPDGKVLAVAYSTGKILLCDIENSAPVHNLHAGSKPTTLMWSAQSKSTSDRPEFFQDFSSQFLPNLPAFEKRFADVAPQHNEDQPEDAKKLRDQTCLNILLVGEECRRLQMYAYGVVHIGTIDFTQLGIPNAGRLMSTCFSNDMSTLSIFTEDDGDNSAGVRLLTFDTTLLSSQSEALRIITLKLGLILTLLSYIDTTVTQMSEAWEDILLEMDSKLKKLAEEKYKVCDGSISTDLFRLLLFGNPSDELHNFLFYTLTVKGLKKLGHSIDNSYTSIQKLLLKHLQSVGQALVYHLSDIKGMSLWPDKFGAVGLSPTATQDAVRAAGSLMLKARELQQVIDASLKDFKAFFRWLYVAMQRLADEFVPSSLTKMSQQDLNFVAQFLRDNFTQDVAACESGFSLEKVGQYLRRAELHKAVDNSNNPWHKLVASSEHLQGSPLLYQEYPTLSLVQVYDMVTASIEDLVRHCAETISGSFRCTSDVCFLTSLVERPFSVKVSQISVRLADVEYLQTAFAFSTKSKPADRLFLCRQPVGTTADRGVELVCMKCGLVASQQSDNPQTRCQQYVILDHAFYDEKALSLLLLEAGGDKGQPALVLLPTAPSTEADEWSTCCKISLSSPCERFLIDKLCTVTDVGELIESAGFRLLENMNAAAMAVSGTRRIACVLFSSRRRVRLFLMDVEDEADEDPTDTSQTDCIVTSGCDPTSAMDDSSYIEVDDENKENSSISDTTAELYYST